MAARAENRAKDELRPVKITPDFVKNADSSLFFEIGRTRVVVTATIESSVPPYIKDTGAGWVTAEYSMLPRATDTRTPRDIARLKLSPRSAEIQRLVGRSLRAVCDLKALGERSIIIDCDVIEADGGTRCASVTGGYIALYLAVKKLMNAGIVKKNPIRENVAAISAGIVNGGIYLDLDYREDSAAAVDFNFIMTGEGGLVELQGTGEERPFTKRELDVMYEYALSGIRTLTAEQKKVTGE